MKKVLLMMVVGGIVFLSSCSKKSDYTCSCVFTVAQDGVILDTENEMFTYLDQKEEDAEDLCAGNESSTDQSISGLFTLTQSNVCTLSEN